MKVVLRGRGGGKTTELIRISARTNSYIVAMSRDEAGRIFAQAQAMGLNIPYPITFDNFLDHQYSSWGIRDFLIDNADVLLQRLSRGVNIVAVSVTDGVNSGTGGE